MHLYPAVWIIPGAKLVISQRLSSSPAVTTTASPERERIDALHREDHRRALRAFFARRLRVAEEIEDHVQDVYVRVLSAGTQTSAVGNWRGMLLRVASSVWVDRFRRDKARGRGFHVTLGPEHELVDDGALSPEAVMASCEKLERVEAALMELDPICRQAFVLARFEGMPHQQIAARLGIQTIKVGRYVEHALLHLVRRTAQLA